MSKDKVKYEIMSPQNVNKIMELYKGLEIYDYILELYGLISYQKDIISQQRLEIIGLKHKQAWKHYDK